MVRDPLNSQVVLWIEEAWEHEGADPKETEVLVRLNGNLRLRDFKRWQTNALINEGNYKSDAAAALSYTIDRVLATHGLEHTGYVRGTPPWIRLAFELGEQDGG